MNISYLQNHFSKNLREKVDTGYTFEATYLDGEKNWQEKVIHINGLSIYLERNDTEIWWPRAEIKRVKIEWCFPKESSSKGVRLELRFVQELTDKQNSVVHMYDYKKVIEEIEEGKEYSISESGSFGYRPLVNGFNNEVKEEFSLTQKLKKGVKPQKLLETILIGELRTVPNIFEIKARITTDFLCTSFSKQNINEEQDKENLDQLIFQFNTQQL